MATPIGIPAGACTLIGAGLFAYGVYQRRKLSASQSWAQTMGTITFADMLRDTGPDSSGYWLNVHYDYEVNGVRYTGKKVEFSQRSYARKKSALAALQQYPVNSSVAVFFDPANPADAVLSRSAPSSILMIVLGIGLLILAGVILLAPR